MLDGRRKRRNPVVRVPEHVEQVALVSWARLQSRKYPALRWLYAIPNGGHRYASVARALKAEGVRAGVSDLHLPVPSKGYCGLWIEMKAKKGVVTLEQAEWLKGMKEMGHSAHVCHGWESARDVIIKYLDPPPGDVLPV